MGLAPGTRLGPYEISAQIGVGGMGEVYQATDSKLKRQVAIKVLPDAVATDPERLARFQREAEVLAALNHPNIAAIYGLEETPEAKALVMELVEGPTLADRIAQGAIPIDEALTIAKQIAEALEAAHEQGIIHRDLKPANVKVREDGTVKVLDFGLAKAIEPAAGSSPNLTQSPTITTPAQTMQGVVLGTAAYMSPEQAKGRVVDKRTDIWAFGCVLYEMLTGRRTFAGDDVSEVLASVLAREPDWTLIPERLAPVLESCIRRCLARNPKNRIHDIADVRLALDGAFGPLAPASQPATVRSRWPGPTALTAVALAAGLLGAGLVAWLWSEPSSNGFPGVVRFQQILRPDTGPNPNFRTVAISPDGMSFAYTGPALFVRRLDASEPRLIRGAGDSRLGALVFSPDGQQLAFWSDGQLRRVAANGGSPAVPIADIDPPFGVRWTEEGIVFAIAREGIFRVSAEGGSPALLIPNESQGTHRFHGPQVLPGGQVLFTIASSNWDRGQIVVQSVGSDDRQVIVENGTDGWYVPTGHLLFMRAGTLLAVPFDAGRLEPTGPELPVMDSIDRARQSGAGHYAVSDTGTLVYVPGTDNVARQLVWRDRSGQTEPIDAAPLRNYVQVRVSPLGTHAVVEIQDGPSDLWTWDFVRESLDPLVVGPANDRRPEWSVDGQYVYFSSDRNDTYGIYKVAVDRPGEVETVVRHPRGLGPNGFTPDGRRLVMTEGLTAGAPPAFSELVLADDESDSQVVPLFRPDYLVDDAHFRPRSGEWFVFESGRSGGGDNIVVRPYPDVRASSVTVSTAGHSPMWGPNGREVFFIERGFASQNRMMRAAVISDTPLQFGRPEELFKIDEPMDGRDRVYDVHPDGTRFLMPSVGEGGESRLDLQRIEVVLNWFEELKRLVPTD